MGGGCSQNPKKFKYLLSEIRNEERPNFFQEQVTVVESNKKPLQKVSELIRFETYFIN